MDNLLFVSILFAVVRLLSSLSRLPTTPPPNLLPAPLPPKGERGKPQVLPTPPFCCRPLAVPLSAGLLSSACCPVRPIRPVCPVRPACPPPHHLTTPPPNRFQREPPSIVLSAEGDESHPRRDRATASPSSQNPAPCPLDPILQFLLQYTLTTAKSPSRRK